MSNAMKYIKNLEAADFDRNQAEAQVQMVLDAIEGDLVTKSDLAVLKSDLAVFKGQIEKQFIETEFRLLARLGFLMVSTTSIAVAALVWLIKI